MKPRSLTFRIITLSAVWIFIALFATGGLLLHYYQGHVEDHYDAHVFMHLEEMAAATRLGSEGQLSMAYRPSDPRFLRRFSGWYWEVRQGRVVLASSPSLAGEALGFAGDDPPKGARVREISGPDGKPLRAQALTIPGGASGAPLTVVVSAPRMGIRDDVIDVAENVLVSFIVLGLGLTVAVVLQIRLALKPLQSISSGIGQIRAGERDRLGNHYPAEVQPLVNELNNLIEHNAVLLKRARNQLGDLAHAIKNPLTVITNEARGLDPEPRELITRQANDIVTSVDHYLTHARVFGAENVLGARTHIRTVAEDLVFAMQRIHPDRDIEFDLSGLGNCHFRGEQQDLEEMLGNLLDNACKWAAGTVQVRCRADGQRCLLSVEDDGPGIPEEAVEQALHRGRRLDETIEGHGLGLSIVQGIAELYGGTLTLSRSRQGGLRAELNLPGG
jgi:signal transduction histidine kinase